MKSKEATRVTRDGAYFSGFVLAIVAVAAALVRLPSVEFGDVATWVQVFVIIATVFLAKEQLDASRDSQRITVTYDLIQKYYSTDVDRTIGKYNDAPTLQNAAYQLVLSTRIIRQNREPQIERQRLDEIQLVINHFDLWYSLYMRNMIDRDFFLDQMHHVTMVAYGLFAPVTVELDDFPIRRFKELTRLCIGEYIRQGGRRAELLNVLDENIFIKSEESKLAAFRAL